MKFTKMQGIGNDYVYVNCFEETVEHPSSLAILVSNRHFGIGSDGLILIRPSAVADFFMEMFIAGVKHLTLHVEDGRVSTVTVDMGEPILTAELIPVVADASPVVREAIEVAGQEHRMTCVSMGNPHAVVFVDDTAAFPLEEVGPAFEFHPAFPRRVNAEFVQVLNRSEANMRVWERGTGETLACGTGACASVVACILSGLTDDEVTMHLLGGDLRIRWNRDNNHVYMTGPAATVFEGEFDASACPCDVPPHVVDPAW